MGHSLPAAIRDPKSATVTALELALSTPSVIDRAKPEAYTLAAETYARRTGDVQFLGSDWQPPEYD